MTERDERGSEQGMTWPCCPGSLHKRLFRGGLVWWCSGFEVAPRDSVKPDRRLQCISCLELCPSPGRRSSKSIHRNRGRSNGGAKECEETKASHSNPAANSQLISTASRNTIIKHDSQLSRLKTSTTGVRMHNYDLLCPNREGRLQRATADLEKWSRCQLYLGLGPEA